jgi:hypothetical protein
MVQKEAPMSRYTNRGVKLTPLDIAIIRKAAQEWGLGEKGFSAALRLIVREWAVARGQLATPAPKAAPGDERFFDGQDPASRGGRGLPASVWRWLCTLFRKP